jgi:hypothetical protein
MRSACTALLATLMSASPMIAQSSQDRPIPEIRQLMKEVLEHQRKLEKVRENYTYSTFQTTQDIDANGRVTKTETKEGQDFFVNGHVIERTIKKNGQPLTGRDLEKENERVMKLVQKAQNTPPGERIEGPAVSVSHLLEIMDVHNPRRENYRGRHTIIFDFNGRKDAKTHGLVEDASKKVQGTIWVDEADRQVAHMEVSFVDNFRIAGGLFASIQKGSNFHFDQAPVSHGLWLPTGGEGTMQARLLLFKNMRQHISERDYDYKVFSVDAQQQNESQVVPPAE